MDSTIWEDTRGAFLRVVVRPNSKEKEFIAEFSPEAIVINLRGPAREGKANNELVKKLSKILGISTAEIILVAGHKSREKTLLIVGIESDSLKEKLSSVT